MEVSRKSAAGGSRSPRSSRPAFFKARDFPGTAWSRSASEIDDDDFRPRLRRAPGDLQVFPIMLIFRSDASFDGVIKEGGRARKFRVVPLLFPLLSASSRRVELDRWRRTPFLSTHESNSCEILLDTFPLSPLSPRRIPHSLRVTFYFFFFFIFVRRACVNLTYIFFLLRFASVA